MSSENWFEIDRHTPDLKVQIGVRILTLTYENTDVVQFGRNYNMFDHIYIHPPEEEEVEEGNIIFNCDGLVKSLIAHDFPRHYFPYPSENIVEFYLTNTATNLDEELGKLSGE